MYVQKVLSRFGMQHNNFRKNPMVLGIRLPKYQGGARIHETLIK